MRRSSIVPVAAALVLLALPAVLSPYTQETVVKIAIYAVFALSLELLVGATGLVSLGHAAFLGIGAYVTVLASGDAGAPLSSVYPGMGSSVLIICFVVVVIGGIGSITGALIASLLVGVVDTFGKVFFAEWSGVGVYVLMAVVLVWRPEGLMKRGF